MLVATTHLHAKLAETNATLLNVGEKLANLLEGVPVVHRFAVLLRVRHDWLLSVLYVQLRPNQKDEGSEP